MLLHFLTGDTSSDLESSDSSGSKQFSPDAAALNDPNDTSYVLGDEDLMVEEVEEDSDDSDSFSTDCPTSKCNCTHPAGAFETCSSKCRCQHEHGAFQGCKKAPQLPEAQAVDSDSDENAENIEESQPDSESDKLSDQQLFEILELSD